MAENPNIAKTRRLARVSLLSALALVLSYIETMIPLPVALPGVKLGLANVSMVVALLSLDVCAGLAVALVKVVASGLLFGSPMMLMYSLGGTALAFAGAAAVSRVPGISAVVVSMVAAILHNAGQLAVASWVLGNVSVMLNLAPLAVCACVTGSVTGAVAAGVLAAQPPAPRGANAVASAAGAKPIDRNANSAVNRPAGLFTGENRFAAAPAEMLDAKRNSHFADEGCRGSVSNGSSVSSGLSVASGQPNPSDSLASHISPATGASAGAGTRVASSFGVYRPGTTLAHRLDPRTKVCFVLLFFVAAFAAKGVLGFAVLVAMTLAAQVASGSSLRQAARVVKPFAWLLAFVLVFDVLFVNSGHVLWNVGPLCISTGGVVFAIENALRFLCVLLGTSALMATTSPTQLTDGFALLLRPLARLGVRTDAAELAISMTLRFIPVFASEFGHVRTAQASRGADFGTGGAMQRAKALVPALIPMFASALRRSETLAFAVEARAFGAVSGAVRTSLRTYPMRSCDAVVLAVALAFAAFELVF